MTAERELEQLKSALRLWANSKTYQEGCKRWSEIVRLIGEDFAQESSGLTPPNQSERAS